MTIRIQRLLPAILLAIVVGGCGTTAQSRFYTLQPVAASPGVPGTAVAVIVGPVTVPATVDRPELVVTTGSNRVEIEAFERWAEPLGDAIALAIAGNLATLLGTSQVAAAPLANFAPEWRVSVRVQRFESVAGQVALIDAVWVAHRNPDGPARQGRTLAQETPQGPGFEALAAAHSRGLATISADIATAIRAATD